MTPRYKRGYQHPSNAELFFLRYKTGKEVWVNSVTLQRYRDNGNRSDKKWKTTTLGRKCLKRCWTRANKKHSSRILAYYKRPDVRQRIRDKHNSKPEVIARREARLQWRAERAAYRASDEFKAILKERNHQKWLKRKAEGKTREHDRKRWHGNLQHRLGQNMRRLINSSLTRMSGAKKAARTHELIGCSVSALKVHLESQFVEGMTWENYGSAWHVDHFVPLARFDLSDVAQQRLAFYFENLKPLWKSANHRKSDLIEVDGKQVRARELRKIIPFKAA